MLVERYLEILGNQLYTEENAKEVTDEIRDHIESLKTGYLEMDYSEEEATKKALEQMGSPVEVGMAFNNPKYAYQQMQKVILFKSFSFGVFLLWLIAIVFYNFDLNTIVTTITHLKRPSFNWFIENFASTFNLLYFILLGGILKYRHTSKTSWLGFELKPVMILWPVTKERTFSWVWTSVAIIYGLPSLALFLVPAYGYGLNIHMLVSEVSFLVVAFFSWYLFRYGEKQRLPKAVVVEEGLVIKDSFISWTAMDKINWTKQTAGNKEFYTFTIKNAKEQVIIKPVEVSSHQYRFMSNLFKQQMNQGGLLCRV